MDEPLLGPPLAVTEPEQRRRVPWWGKVGIGAAILLFVLVVAGFVIHVPYSTISPGEAVRLTQLVKVEGAKTYPEPRGDIRLLFVRERNHVNLWRYLLAQLDSDTEVFKEKELNPTGRSQQQQNDEADQQMADAKNAATKVALEAAGYKVRVAPGLIVSEFVFGMPAEKVLKYGDVLLSADGHPITRTRDLTDAIAKHQAGEQVTLDILRKGKPLTVEVGIASEDNRRLIGVVASPRFDFPVKVSIDTAGIGGPSGGLAMSLAILDDLTPGNLTGGKRVAVTGTIGYEGTVGEIGGIEQKAVNARAAGARLFIVPQCTNPASKASCETDLRRATKRVGSKVKVAPVATFDEALRVLRENGGDPVEKVGPDAKAA
jgi:PDZ domain-containing protein